MPGLVLKRSHEEMEAGSREQGFTLQNHDSNDGETPRKRQMVEPANGIPSHPQSGNQPVNSAARVNGTTTSQSSVDQNMQSSVTGIPTPASAEDMPPELEGVALEFYSPLGLLVERLAQNTFENLHDVIDDLAESSQLPAYPPGSSATAGVNTERKMKLWQFAQDARAKFVKLLVLSQWCRNAGSIIKIIDIFDYLKKQRNSYQLAHYWIGSLTSIVTSQNVSAPDIKSSLKILSDGKADWISDLGYIPKKPLTTEEVLQALREINTVLTIRLGLHQRPPECLRDYEVHDGRVTFRVPDEFELDLSVGSEDHSEQLYFLDLRFAFSPGGGRLHDDHVRADIEARVNWILRTKGLSECYDFLHDLTLTHKLSIFRSQARKLMASRWGDNIKLEIVHRALVLQYWTNRPGGKNKKNWIEIGIRKSPPKSDVLAGSRDASCLSLRWHRHGKEVLDHGLEIDPSELSLETILKETIAAHTNYIFSDVKGDLTKQSETDLNRVFRVKQRVNPIEPADCALDVRFPDGKRITVAQEPVSGRFALMPPSALQSRYEVRLNSLFDPAAESGKVIRELRAATASERYQKQLAMIGWSPVPVPKLGTQTIQATFNRRDVHRVEYCRPPHWKEEWCLALSHHTSGCEMWHLMRLKEDMNAQASKEDVLLGRERSPFKSAIMICYDPSGCVAVDGKESTSASRVWNIQSSVPLQAAFAASGVSGSAGDGSGLAQNKYAFLFSLAAHGAAIASQFENGARLAKLKTPEKSSDLFSFEPAEPNSDLRPVVSRDDDGPDNFQNVSIARLRLDLWNDKLRKYYTERVMTSVVGVYSGDGTVVTVSHAELHRPLPVSTGILRFPGGAFQVNTADSRCIAVQLSVKTGETVILKLVECLLSFSKMMSAAKCLQSHSLDVRQIEFNRIDVNLESLNTAVTSRGYVHSPEQLGVTFHRNDPLAREGVDAIEFSKEGPYAKNQRSWQAALQDGGLALVATRLPLVHPITMTADELSKAELPIRPYVVYRNTNLIRLLWGQDGGHVIELELALSLTSTRQPVWRARLIRRLKEGSTQPPPEALIKLDGLWKSEIAYSKGEGYVGSGAEVIVETEHASATVWHIIDTLRPAIEEFYESVQKESGEGEDEGGKPEGGEGGGDGKDVSKGEKGKEKDNLNGKEATKGQKEKDKEKEKDTGKDKSDKKGSGKDAPNASNARKPGPGSGTGAGSGSDRNQAITIE